MQKNSRFILAAVAAGALISSGAVRAATPQTEAQQKMAANQATTDKDVSHISNDGASAFQDLNLTRLAIFDGQIASAKKYIERADAAFAKARTDETAFTKAEADLTPPPNKPQPNTPAKTDAEMKTPVVWLPVDGQMLIGEDFSADPKKAAAVEEANKKLKRGDRKAALDTLKLAAVDIDFVIEVLPLEKTIASVHSATTLINDGKYYEASQVLRGVDDSQRFDLATISGKPSTKS